MRYSCFVPLQAMIGGRGKVIGNDQFWESGCNIVVGCHCGALLLLEGEGNHQFERNGCGTIAGCHCGVPLWCAMVGGVFIRGPVQYIKESNIYLC